MKFILSAMVVLFACTSQAQNLNKKEMDKSHAREILINNCTRDSLIAFPEFKTAYDPNYANYTPDATVVAQLENVMKHEKITIVLGTWCGDSKLQVPHFYKVLDAAHINTDDVHIICVDGVKQADNGLIGNMNIQRVPTFIFSDKDGKELGRITEHPTKTLEADMLAILSTRK